MNAAVLPSHYKMLWYSLDKCKYVVYAEIHA